MALMMAGYAPLHPPYGLSARTGFYRPADRLKLLLRFELDQINRYNFVRLAAAAMD
jgi:hypothetical protein